MTYRFKTGGGVCSQGIEIEIGDNGRIRNIQFYGGCPGNLQGIGKLAAGMTPLEVADKLEGIRCGGKPTSCPDQLAHALRAIAAKGK